MLQTNKIKLAANLLGFFHAQIRKKRLAASFKSIPPDLERLIFMV
jgi:hypothetical protein